MKFLTRWFVRIPLMVISAIFVIGFAIANRGSVLVSLDPFSTTAPAIGASIPLWLLVFGSFLVGILLGGVAAWSAQARTSLKKSAKLRAAEKQTKAEQEAASDHVPIIAPDKKVSVLPSPAISKAS